MKRGGLWLAMAAVLVATPRLVLTFLAGDRIGLSPSLTAALIAVSGTGAAVVLSAGQLYIVHVIGTVERRLVLSVLWAGVLGMTAVLVTPMVVAGLEARTLPEVLTQSRLAGWPARWGWAAIAVLAVELAAAVCVYASRLHGRDAEQRAGMQQQLQQLHAELAELRARARRARPAAAGSSAGSVLCRNGCGYQGSVMGERAHQRYCAASAAGGASSV